MLDEDFLTAVSSFRFMLQELRIVVLRRQDSGQHDCTRRAILTPGCWSVLLVLAVALVLAVLIV